VAAAVLGFAVPAAGCGVFSPHVDQETPVAMTVSSEAFTQNILQARYTCSVGHHAINPPLSWAGAPPGTKSIALVVDDSNAPVTPFVYWLVFDISPTTSQMAEGQLPPGAKVARNSTGGADYDAPCPGNRSHQYRFTVYALNTMLNLPAHTSLQSAWSAIAQHTIGRGRAAPYAMSVSP
jgi:hypothetical protein